MNKYSIVAATGLVAIMLAAAAYAADPAPAAAPAAPAPAAGGAAPAKGAGGDKADVSINFNAHKIELLKRISDRIADMQKRKSCVEAANDVDAVRTCLHWDQAAADAAHKDEPGSKTPAAAAPAPAAPESGKH